MKLLEKRTRTIQPWRIRTIPFQSVRPYGEPRTAFTSLWKRGLLWHGACHWWANKRLDLLWRRPSTPPGIGDAFGPSDGA